MVAVTETFIELFKRQPNEADKIRLMSVQKALRLPDDDPLWTILIALDYYQKLYEETPAKILEATQTAARTTITAAEASTTEKLVNGALAIANDRMDRARATQWPLVIVCALLSVALIGLGVSFWFAAKQFQAHEAEIAARYETKLAAAKEQLNNTLTAKISAVESAAANQLAKDKAVLDWVHQYLDVYEDKNFQSRVDFAAQNQVFIDAVKPLSVVQRDNLIRIVSKADRWREIRSSAKLPWPCFSVIKPNGRDNRETTICEVGLEGDIAPQRAIAPPHPPRPPRPPHTIIPSPPKNNLSKP
ncbi:hypothetical protein CCP3SC15_310009 [Gammaproteobacteria bacterium]